MTLRSDSHNYQAHERASQRLELEFGHDLVPGKHAKRDRERQPDMPDAAIDHSEWQLAERGQFDHKARKAQITALYQASDDGRAFKAALEEAGYILARGDKRDFVLLDEDARVHSLGRQVQDVRAKELREFMADIDPNHLPSVKEARGILRDKPEPPTLEPSAPEPEPVPQVPEIATSADASQASERLETLREKIEQRHAAALADQARRHDAVVEALREQQERSAAEAIDAFAAQQARQNPIQRPEEPEGLDRLWRAVREAVNEDAKAERFAAEERANDDAAARREIALNEMADAVYAANKAEIDKLIREQARERADLLSEQSRELERRLAEEHRRIALEREYERRRLEAEARAREGPERDPRAR
jgi:hypothetical protein